MGTLKVSYGTAYVFKRSQIICILSNDYEFLRESELDVLNLDCRVKESDYCTFLEKAFEEDVIHTFPIISSIRKGLNLDLDEDLMNHYNKKHFLLKRYKDIGYTIKDISYVLEYLDKCSRDEVTFDKATFKVMATTSLGRKLTEFVLLNNINQFRSDNLKLENEFLIEMNKCIILKVKYENFEMKKFVADILSFTTENKDKMTCFKDLLIPINKSGYKKFLYDSNSSINDYFIMFLRGEVYIYTEIIHILNNILQTINNEIYYLNSAEKTIHKVLSKKKMTIFEPNAITHDKLELRNEDKIGILMRYVNDSLTFSLATNSDNKININENLMGLKPLILQVLDKYILS